MKEPVDHIIRPTLPWRIETGPFMTECGYDATKVKTLTRDEYLRRVKDLGQQRTAMLTCMTCAGTMARWAPWSQDPRKAIGREVEWECAWRTERGHQLKDELLAIASLIDAHPDEFRQLLLDTDARRQWLELKARNERPQ